jgi:hypothetical protein
MATKPDQTAQTNPVEGTSLPVEKERMLASLQEKEKNLLARMEQIKSFPREEQAAAAARTQAALEGVRERMKQYA